MLGQGGVGRVIEVTRADTGDVSLVTHQDFSRVNTVHEEKFWRYHEQSCAFFFNASPLSEDAKRHSWQARASFSTNLDLMVISKSKFISVVNSRTSCSVHSKRSPVPK